MTARVRSRRQLQLILAIAGVTLCLSGCGGQSSAPSADSTQRATPASDADAEAQALLGQALGAMSAQRWEDVGRILQPLLERPTPPADAQWIAGSAAFELGRYPEATALLTEAVSRKPDYLPAASALGFAQRELGDFAAAQATFASIVAARPTAYKALYGLGLIALDQGQLPEARRQLEASLALEPAYRKAHAALGRLLFEEGRLEEARVELERVVEEWPSNEQALYQLAQVQGALGDQAAADVTLARRAEVYATKEQLSALAAQRRSGLVSATNYAREVQLRLLIGDPAEASRALSLGLRAYPNAPELMALVSSGLVSPQVVPGEPEASEPADTPSSGAPQR